VELMNDSDQLELARLIIDLAWRMDHGKAATAHELFVDEGELIVGPDEVVRGRDAIREWGSALDQAGVCMRHVCSNMLFRGHGDNYAGSTTLVTLFLRRHDEAGSPLPWAIIEDHDRFVRTDQGWRFVSRRWEQLFSRTPS
jgi:hypothetical protein